MSSDGLNTLTDYPPSPQPVPANHTAVWAVWFGVGATFTWWAPFLGLGLAVAALVQGWKARALCATGEATNTGVAISALVLGGLAALPAAAVTLAVLVLMVAMVVS